MARMLPLGGAKTLGGNPVKNPPSVIVSSVPHNGQYGNQTVCSSELSVLEVEAAGMNKGSKAGQIAPDVGKIKGYL